MVMVCALLLSFLGAATIYLTHRQQRLLRRPLALGYNVIGVMAILASLWCWCIASGAAAGIAGTATTLMLAWVALPYMAWWRRRHAAIVRTEQP
ncbi:hypothetical protein [Dyella caseinilytica]|uniref:Uncharacterized protein n=1 Tax=Dyella caseinilytica TaxID=1849581 RepID=A0ABX7GZ41_9GAMM|nr:hypothetical protein [Dyella caseinilytica]QRN55203.1 hypothetical protein ISN74_07700 [Dyella caseinilytica]GGA00108.1 hypothetical protein GCM10011408_21140 [Dyella caseinilytica]